MLQLELYKLGRLFMPATHVHISAFRFAELGGHNANNAPGLSIVSPCFRFHSLFGVSPLVCSDHWTLLRVSRPSASRPIHWQWTLLFLKLYGSEAKQRTIAQVDEKIIRKWSKCFVHLLADLEIVRLILQ